uniref:low-density lipoprotein receptor-related protein 2-like isoform X1 n=1 Tax=Styela clava TaxID=7725 RepID=UPI0019395DEB|nr:low-density lipoprotein receptor-related protein 2-like isoform X1 [Styela clava]
MFETMRRTMSIIFKLVFIGLLGHQTRGATTCGVVECEFWEYQCNSGECINLRFFCDGIYDCPDKSDEILEEAGTGCQNPLNDLNLQCKLPEQYFCDSFHHCYNKTDENETLCKNKKYGMRCDKYGHCLNKLLINCGNQLGYQCSDEIPCKGDVCSRRGGSSRVLDLTNECESISTFSCNSGECLEPDKFCDGIIDCKDGSDEVVANSTNVGEGTGLSCSNKWNNVAKHCILPSRYVCDIIDHCDDRVDECQPGCKHSFICDNGKCLRGKKTVPSICDGKDDCGDSSDECNSICQGKNNVFHCNDEKKTCIAIELFCNGRVDCPDGSDEIISTENVTDGTSCTSRHNPSGLRCVLPEHHVCDDVRHCKDVEDERYCKSSVTDDSHYTCKNNNTIYAATKVCNFKDDCCDSSDECGIPGCNKTFTCPNNGKCIAFDKFCDGNDDCEDGSDEITSNMSGFMCENKFNDHNKKCVLPQQYVCDNLDHCENRADECGSDCRHSFICDDGQCINRGDFCDGTNHCRDNSDERMGELGFKCDVTQKFGDVIRSCVLPQKLLFDDTLYCKDHSDECGNNGTCFKCFNDDFFISKRQVCDGIFDCPDLSDECLCMEENDNVSKVCNSYCQGQDTDSCTHCENDQIVCDGGDNCINVTYICDGISHCVDGTDEASCQAKNEENWSRQSASLNFKCETKNPQGSPEYATMCDGIPQCAFAEDECSIIKQPVMDQNASKTERQFLCGNKTMEVCKALDIKDDFLHCPGKPHHYLSKDICDGVEDCERTSPDKLSPDEQGCKDRVKCPTSRPKESRKSTIHISSFCDARIDCEGEEDEAEELCQGKGLRRFYCESRKLGDNSSDPGPLFVTSQEVLDGKPDCKDGSDECPTKLFHDNMFSSRHRMIKNVILSGVVWIMGLLAFFGNSIVMYHSITKLRSQTRFSPMMRSNYILVFNLATADLLMGVYLLALAIQNSKTNGKYCRYDQEWRTGSVCASLGSLAMISIQSSVCFLVILTTYRMIAVLRPFRVDSLRVRYTVVFVGLIWFFSLFIAIVPRLPDFKNYFVSSVYISPGVYFFDTNTPTKMELSDFANVLSAYSHDFENTGSLSWQQIHHSIKSRYPQDWPELRILGEFGYYSGHSVCLPQLFLKVKDSAWLFSIIIMLFDFLSFLYIVMSYRLIYNDASRQGALRENRSAVDENKTLQSRITRLVLADFFCLVPVCLTSFLSVLGVEINPVAYAIAAIVLLPINSALNPILYSNVFGVFYNSCVTSTTACLGKILMTKRRKPFGGNYRKAIQLEQHCFSYNRHMTSSITTNEELDEMKSLRRESNDSWNTANQCNLSAETTRLSI